MFLKLRLLEALHQHYCNSLYSSMSVFQNSLFLSTRWICRRNKQAYSIVLSPFFVVYRSWPTEYLFYPNEKNSTEGLSFSQRTHSFSTWCNTDNAAYSNSSGSKGRSNSFILFRWTPHYFTHFWLEIIISIVINFCWCHLIVCSKMLFMKRMFTVLRTIRLLSGEENNWGNFQIHVRLEMKPYLRSNQYYEAQMRFTCWNLKFFLPVIEKYCYFLSTPH